MKIVWSWLCFCFLSACGSATFKANEGSLVDNQQKVDKKGENQSIDSTYDTSATVSTKHEGKIFSQTFLQSKDGIIDILVVVDNSASMGGELQNLASKLTPLVSQIKDSDWQISVTSTDTRNPCSAGILKKSDSQKEDKFLSLIETVKTWRKSPNEQGIKAAVEGMRCQETPWLRDESALAILIVSDEDNCNLDGRGCEDDPWSQDSYLLDQLSKNREIGKNSRVYGIFGHPSLPKCSGVNSIAHQYARIVEKTKGKWGSICDNDYTKTLQAVSRDMYTILLNSFKLDFPPLPGSLKVLVDGEVFREPFEVNEDLTITFENPPPVGSKIVIEYMTQEKM